MTDRTNQMDTTSIRTPDQRLRVFVSSTLGELAAERAAVSRAITAMGLTPVLFELGARPHPPRELYRAYLAQSDIFVGIYWQRYGWVAPDMDISGLEDEFLGSQGMPRLLYLKSPAPDREERLTAMLGRLETEATDSYRHFRSPTELGRLVRDDLAVLLSEQFSLGHDRTAQMLGPREQPEQRRPRSLPVATTSLVGRDDDIDRVVELLQTPGVRLVNLTGPGGIGKTRLAVAVGERLDDSYQLGAVFVPLASIGQPELVLSRVAEAVDAHVEGTRAPLDVLAEHLADIPVLLVLDNLEQVVAVGPDIERLLERCPGLQILATSRTVLRLRSEHEYAVDPLTVPGFPGSLPPDQLGSLAAVELFVDRARAVRRDFALTDDNAAAVAEICRLLDGLPLGIELAAARIRLLEPTALLARLENRLDSLGTGPVDLPERQRTLRATVEWSVGLLNEAESDMLATLSVFEDGWSIESATQVADMDDERTLDLLDALAGHSLVQVTTEGAVPRFAMLRVVRETAAELLVDAQGADVERRHAAYFRSLVDQADNAAYGLVQADWAVWGDRLQTEEGNLRVAFRWFLDHDIEPLPRMFNVLSFVLWQRRDRMLEARAWVEEVLPRAAELEPRGRLQLQLVAGITAIETGVDDKALAAAQEIERLIGEVDDTFLVSMGHMLVSWTQPIVDDVDGAVASVSRALDGFRALDAPYMTASTLLELGMLELVMGRLDAARGPLAEAEALGAQNGNVWFTSITRVQLASLAVEEGRIDAARSLLDQTLDVGEDTALSTHPLTFALVVVAQLSLAEGAPRRAAQAMGAAEALRQRAGLRVWPTERRREAELLARIEGALDPREYKAALNSGAHLTRRDALEFVHRNAS